MRFDLATCVWGPWHVAIMGQVMLPTLLAPGNLPALAKRYDVRYRISTTHADRSRIEALPIFRALVNTVAVDMVVDTNEERPDPVHHVNWYHKAIQEARGIGALCAFVPPDVAWSDGTFDHMGTIMAAGKLGSAMPYVRVISETCLPNMQCMARTASGNLPIPSGDLVRLGMRHLHPLSAAAMAHGRHGRPSLEMVWRVPGQGLLLRHVVRELFSFDPQRIKLTHIWYAGEGCPSDTIHIVKDSDDMFMLSFAPLFKDMPLYIQGYPVDAMALARQSLHPWNDTPLNTEFPRHRIRLHYGSVMEDRWRRVERRSDVEMKKELVMRDALRIWTAIKDLKCGQMARLLSVALQTTPLARRWPYNGPVTAFVPMDHAFRKPSHLLATPTKRTELMRMIFNHVIRGAGSLLPGQTCPTLGTTTASITQDHEGMKVNGARILHSLSVAPHQIHLVDKPVAPQPTA